MTDEHSCFASQWFANQEAQIISKPHVVVIGIEDYEIGNGLESLIGVKQDVCRMLKLWNKVYKYKDISTVYSLNMQEECDEQVFNMLQKEYIQYLPDNREKVLTSSQNFYDYLALIRSKIDINRKNDSLIFYFSGHGVKDAIILGNGEKFAIKQIISMFNGKNCIFLRNKPKILIFDCCRGNKLCETVAAPIDINNNNLNSTAIAKKSKNMIDYNNNSNITEPPIKTKLKSYVGVNRSPEHSWIDERFHIDSGFCVIYGNVEDYAVVDSNNGSCLTNAIERVFDNPDKVKKYCLSKLLLPIREETKRIAGRGNKRHGVPCQLVEHRETLERQVHFHPQV